MDEASLQSVRPGVVVGFEGSEYTVERTMRMQQDVRRWTEHRLSSDASGRSVWLEVHDDPELQVLAHEPGEAAPRAPEGSEFRDGDLVFTLVERGLVRYRTEERVGAAKTGSVSFVEFAAGDRRLTFERYDSATNWELLRGRVISPCELTLRWT